MALLAIAEEQLRRSDRAGALKTLHESMDACMPDAKGGYANVDLAAALAEAGDAPAALRIVAARPATEVKDYAYRRDSGGARPMPCRDWSGPVESRG